MSKLDLTKPYRTREGYEAAGMIGPDGRLYGWRKESLGMVAPSVWNADGSHIGFPDAHSLVNVPEKRTVKVWINIYGDGDKHDGVLWRRDREQADSGAMVGRIACIEREITFTVGEGLEP